jgi:hypothetical protein
MRHDAEIADERGDGDDGGGENNDEERHRGANTVEKRVCPLRKPVIPFLSDAATGHITRKAKGNYFRNSGSREMGFAISPQRFPAKRAGRGKCNSYPTFHFPVPDRSSGAALAQPIERRIRNAGGGCSSHPGGASFLSSQSGAASIQFQPPRCGQAPLTRATDYARTPSASWFKTCGLRLYSFLLGRAH